MQTFLQFQRGIQALKLQLFKLLCVSPSSEAYSEPNQNLTYQSFLKSILFTSQICFNIALTNIEATLKQRWDYATSTLKKFCALLKSRCIDIVQRWFNVISTSDTDDLSTWYKVGNSMPDFVLFSTSHQRYFKVDSQRWNNFDPTLNVRWVRSID